MNWLCAWCGGEIATGSADTPEDFGLCAACEARLAESEHSVWSERQQEVIDES